LTDGPLNRPVLPAHGSIVMEMVKQNATDVLPEIQPVFDCST